MQITPVLLRGGVGFALGLALISAAAADDKNKFCQVTYVNNSEATFGVSAELTAGDRFLLDDYQVDQATIGSSYGPKSLRPGKTITLELVGMTSCKMETTLSNGTDFHTSLVNATGSNHDTECNKKSTNNFMKTYGCDCDGSGGGHNSDITIVCTSGGS